MPAYRASSLLEEFFSRATRHHELKWVSLSVNTRAHPIAQRLADILGVPPCDFMHERLTVDQSDACLKEIIRLESVAPADARTILLNQF
jgi:hypothetical protein